MAKLQRRPERTSPDGAEAVPPGKKIGEVAKVSVVDCIGICLVAIQWIDIEPRMRDRHECGGDFDRRAMHEQDEFLFADGVQPELHLAHPLDDLINQISAVWAVPLGRKARVSFRDRVLPEMIGKIELVRAPDLPLNPREPLRLRLKGVQFSSLEIAAWSLVEE